MTLRGAAARFLTDTGNVVSGAITSDLGGGGTTVWTASTADVPCRIDPISAGETTIAGRISDRTTHYLTIPSEIDLDERDRFGIDSRGTFEVTAVRARTGERLGLFEVVQVF